MMDLKDNTYEDIEESSSGPASLFKSQSDSNLLRLMQECGQEVEIINSLIKGRKRPLYKPPLPNVTATASCAVDSTFSLYGHQEPEQGFYKCHDSIYDVPEGQRIPDLMKKTKTKATTATTKAPTTIVLVAPPPMFTNLDKQCHRQRRLSLDSGRGTSVAGMYVFSLFYFIMIFEHLDLSNP